MASDYVPSVKATSAYTTLDKFFLPSGTNMCGSVNANEGRVFPYMVDYIVEALVDAGKTVEEYNSAAVSEVGKIYVNRIAGLFYVSNGSGGYTNVTNDDRTNTTTCAAATCWPALWLRASLDGGNDV